MKKDNLKILILIGVPASGKSTWAKDYVRRNEGWVRVSRDEFRLMLKNAQVCEPKIEDLITTLINGVIRKALMKKLNVIIDNTNLRVRYINQFIDEFKDVADIDYRVFDISLDKAIERDEQREMKVGTGVIKKMYNDFKVLMDSFNFQPVKMVKGREFVVPNFKSDLPDAVIFDIDGTLALMGDRGPFDWLRVHRDDKNEIVAEHIEFHRSKGRKIIIVSGRDEICRKLTEDWMELYGINYDEFLMRPEGDSRKDTLIKREIYQSKIEGKYNLLAVYDDRLQVLDMWYGEGIFTFNVNQGNKEF
jgi:predicted kinase